MIDTLNYQRMSTPHQNTFATTRWTQVLSAQGTSESAQAALSDLCAAYYEPVLSFLKRHGCGTEDPSDITHEFFASLLSRNGLSGVNQERGRFRSYLLAALKHFLANRSRDRTRQKRGNGATHVSLDTCQPDTTLESTYSEDPTLQAQFDHDWALAVVERALQSVQKEASQSGSSSQFHILKAWLSFDDTPMPQSQAAERLGISEGAVKVAIHRLRHRFRQAVRQEIVHTLPEGSSVDEELHFLIESLTFGARAPSTPPNLPASIQSTL